MPAAPTKRTSRRSIFAARLGVGTGRAVANIRPARQWEALRIEEFVRDVVRAGAARGRVVGGVAGAASGEKRRQGGKDQPAMNHGLPTFQAMHLQELTAGRRMLVTRLCEALP